MRGRRPIPTYMKVLRGNPGCRALPENEPDPVAPEAPPEAPEYLIGYARDEWHRIVAELMRIKLFTIVDTQPLAAYCEAYARWRNALEAYGEMARRDPTFRGLMMQTRAGTTIQNPLVITARAAANDMVRYATEFGLTPSARARIAAGPTGGGPDRPNKFDGLIG